MMRRVFLVVMDSVGIGAAPDAGEYGDAGAATLQHVSQAVGGLRLPVMERMGLGNILPLVGEHGPIVGVKAVEEPMACWGAMRERSVGKDTITGHWEIGGLLLDPGFYVFPVGETAFPQELTEAFVGEVGRPIVGNCRGSGTELMDQYGAEAEERGAFLVYTSADSVFQIAAHTGVIPLEELYRACRVARRLCDPYRVGRVIARPFTGKAGGYRRTAERVDFAYEPSERTLLQHVEGKGVPVYSVGKIEDIFAHRGITRGWHTGDNASSMAEVERLMREMGEGFVFANFIDFDMQHGHRRDAAGYGACLEEMDRWLEGVLPLLRVGDVLVLTADHGNDPIFKGTDHTRELVPLLVYEPGVRGRGLGLRDGFYDVAQSVAARFGLPPMARGVSIW